MLWLVIQSYIAEEMMIRLNNNIIYIYIYIYDMIMQYDLLDTHRKCM